jgi:molybdopterin converting factor small subunit
MVTVKLFGTLRLASGVKELQLEAGSVKELYPLVQRELRIAKPESAVTEKALRGCLVAVNGVRVSPRAKLRDGDTVYFFPAVAGG